jgi:tetratricopeptide (TPR) repeat protein
MKLNRTQEAIEFLNEAIKYNPNFAPSHVNLATVYLNNNNMEDARRAYQRASGLLQGADKDLRLIKEAEKIGEKLTDYERQDPSS